MKKNVCLLTLLVLVCLSGRSWAKSPNVLMIISDDQAWNDFSFMDHQHIQTPHLDRLARQSAVFTRGYVPSSLCRPSLMTLVTGLYPHQHGITGNDPPKGTDRQLMLKHVNSHPTLPRMLAKKGYLSLQTGKWWEGSPKLAGFTHAMTHGDPSRGGRHGDVGLKIGREGLQPIYDFVEACGDRPFFIWYAPFLPHSPHNPPQRLFDKYQDKTDSPFVARYWAMCDWFDETCGELLGFLDQTGKSENTIVVFVTDNGWLQEPNSRKYAAKSKRSPYEGGIRTPIMIRWPGKIKPMHDEQTLVNSIDLVPTILSACGLKPTDEMPGIDLLDVCAGKGTGRNMIFGEILEHDVADIDNPQASLLYRWCISGDWKLIVPTGKQPSELYNLQTDPWETINLADKHTGKVEQFTRRLDQWWALDR